LEVIYIPLPPSKGDLGRNPFKGGLRTKPLQKRIFDKIHKTSNSLITLFVQEITIGPYLETEKTI
jgi:hypothetical protein